MLHTHKMSDYGRAYVHEKAAHMPRAAAVTSSRRPTNVTLPDALLREARELGINLSQACERGLIAEVATLRRERWLEQNHDAIRDWNEHVRQHGLPLAAFRSF